MCPITGVNQSNGFQIDMSVEKILSAEHKVEQRLRELTNEVIIINN
jgi:hypothetical protein